MTATFRILSTPLVTNHLAIGCYVALDTDCVVSIMNRYAEGVNIISGVTAQFLKRGKILYYVM
jgi:hypothetical protein